MSPLILIGCKYNSLGTMWDLIIQKVHSVELNVICITSLTRGHLVTRVLLFVVGLDKVQFEVHHSVLPYALKYSYI